MIAELTIDILRQLKAQGLTDEEVGRQYGVSASSVGEMRRTNHIAGMTKRQAGRRAASRRNEGTGLLDRFGTEEKLRAELNRLQAEGHASGKALAQAIGASVTTVRYWLQKFGGAEKGKHLSSATPPSVVIYLDCDECGMSEEATLPQPVALAARSAWKRIHPGNGAPCQAVPDGGEMKEAYERKWCR